MEDFGISHKVSVITQKYSALTQIHQILSVTCDNASNNNVLVEELADLLDGFPGEANRTRCFLHIINLVVKTVIRQFDIPTAKTNENEALNGLNDELKQLSEGQDLEEMVTRTEDDTEMEDDEDEGWVDGLAELPADERGAVENAIVPVRLLLAKVCQLIWSR